MKIFLLLSSSLIFLINISCFNCNIKKTLYDSLFNLYKTGKFRSHETEEVSNTTWKEYFISEKIKKPKKIIPYKVNEDEELDLFIQDSSENLYWINNIRGTSKEFTHQKISKNFVVDFVLSNQIHKNINKLFILTIGQGRDKLIKYKKNPYYDPLVTNDTVHDTKSYWDETVFLDINKDKMFSSLMTMSSYIKIKSINLYEESEDEQILLLNMENIQTGSCQIIKIKIQGEKIISSYKVGVEHKSINLIGLYDMNNDGFIDILYLDTSNTLYIYLNQDPFYFSIELYKLEPTINIENIPRIFIYDVNKDMYPDIITGDTKENMIKLLLNPGKNYWRNVINYYNINENMKSQEIYKDLSWQYLSLINPIDITSPSRKNYKLKDFAVISIEDPKKLTCEIIAIYDKEIYWFIEKNEDNYYSSKSTYQNLIQPLRLSNIFIEKQSNFTDTNYDLILDINLNNDIYPEFMLYSYDKKSLFYIQRIDTIIANYGWSQGFWIYLMITIYVMSTSIGMFEFWRLKKLNEKYSKMGGSFLNNEEPKKNLELGQL